MASSLIRGRYVVAEAPGRDGAEVLEDGAVFQRDGVIRRGRTVRGALRRRHRADEVLGSPDHVVLPGFVNAPPPRRADPVPARVARLPARALVREPARGAGGRPVPRHALLGLRDAGVGHHHRPAHPRLARRPGLARPRRSPTASCRRTGTSACGSRTPTCSGIRTGWPTRPTRTSCVGCRRTSRRRSTPSCPARRSRWPTRSTVPEPVGGARPEPGGADADPARAGEPPLVLRSGARPRSRLLGPPRGRHAHAPQGDRVPARVRAPADRRAPRWRTSIGWVCSVRA